MLTKKLKKIPLVYATSGCADRIEYSMSSERVAWMPNFSRLVFMPIPHFNIISMIGMGQKLEYLIWRKSIDGFFTGLEPDGDLITWSYTNGKLLYKK